MLSNARKRYVTPHAPSTSWFIASLIIETVAVVSILTPIPYVTTYGAWLAITAYVVLAVANLAQTQRTPRP